MKKLKEMMMDLEKAIPRAQGLQPEVRLIWELLYRLLIKSPK